MIVRHYLLPEQLFDAFNHEANYMILYNTNEVKNGKEEQNRLVSCTDESVLSMSYSKLSRMVNLDMFHCSSQMYRLCNT